MSSLNLNFSPAECQEILTGLAPDAVGLDLNLPSETRLSVGNASPWPRAQVTTKEVIRVFTDGSCLNNGKKNSTGGIGIHFPDGQFSDVSLPYHGHLIHDDDSSLPHGDEDRGKITNQRAELTAIHHALQIVTHEADAAGDRRDLRNVEVHLYTDSAYAINSLTNWCYTWKTNNWKTSNGKPVKNRHLIESLLGMMKRVRVTFFHAEAHTDRTDERSLGNARADFLATQATKQGVVKRMKK